jgi:hypothetical protein
LSNINSWREVHEEDETALDPCLQKMTELVDRVFCFYEMPRAPAKGQAKADSKMQDNQVALEAYSGGYYVPESFHEPEPLDLHNQKPAGHATPD